MADILVKLAASGDGYTADVSIIDGRTAAEHRVAVPAAAIERLAPDADPAPLVRASFEFLLEREARESIVQKFEITLIAGYFPDYPAEFRRWLPVGGGAA